MEKQGRNMAEAVRPLACLLSGLHSGSVKQVEERHPETNDWAGKGAGMGLRKR